MGKKNKSFGQLRREWLPNGESDNINYCIPINLGVVAQRTAFQANEVEAAVLVAMKKLSRHFGDFQKSNSTSSHNQLIVMHQDNNPLAEHIAAFLKNEFGAQLVPATEEEIKKYCWVTIAAWDGIASDSSEVYQTIRKILSTRYDESKENQYKLRFPENRPIYQIVLPLVNSGRSSIDYTVREIYPYLLETINSGSAWFDRNNYKSSRNERAKRRNFNSNAKKVRRFNEKIVRFDEKIDDQTKYIYDLLPWHHKKKIQLPLCAEIANLREIYYDIISMKAQKRQNIQMYLMMALAFLGLSSFALYSDLDIGKVFLVIYLLFMMCTYGLYWLFVKRVNAHKDYLEFRALAEGMRVQCHWYCAGINESVGTNYTVKFQKDMLWAKQAFNAWYMADCLNNPVNSDYTPNNKMIKTEWLGTLPEKGRKGYKIQPPSDCPSGTKGQYGFYSKRKRQDYVKSSFSRAFAGIITIVSVLVSVVFTGLLLFDDFGHENLFVFIISFMNILTLSITYLDNIKAYKELSDKYSYCSLLAQKALQDYDEESSNADKVKDIFKQFGIEALEENAEWLMIKNDREPEVMS